MKSLDEQEIRERVCELTDLFIPLVQFSVSCTRGIIPKRCELRQVKYRGNLIEQDHRFIKRLTKPGMGFFSDLTAWRTLQGFEIMNMMRKGQLQGIAKGDVNSSDITHIPGE